MSFEELNSVIKHLYYTDAMFHTMIVHHAHDKDWKPYDSMLLLNRDTTISELSQISHMKRVYENMILQLLHITPFKDFATDELFQMLDKNYEEWAHKLENTVTEILIFYDGSSTTNEGDLKLGNKTEGPE